MKMMNSIVEEVLRKGHHGKGRPVTTRASTVPLRPLHSGKSISNTLPAKYQFLRDVRRVLIRIVPVDGGLILIPISKLRIILGQHQLQTLVEDPINVPHMARILQK